MRRSRGASPMPSQTPKTLSPHLFVDRLLARALADASDLRIFLRQTPMKLRLICERDRPGERRRRRLVTTGSRERFGKAHPTRRRVRLAFDDLLPEPRGVGVPAFL